MGKRKQKEKDFQKDGDQKFTKAHCRDAKDAVRHSANDISWYNANPQLMQDAASLSYAEALGLMTDFGGSNDSTGYRIPGICVVSMAPSFGISSDGSSVLNVAARRLYAYVRHANSGSRNYEAADLMTYVLAMSSVYAAYSELARLYGTVRLYSTINRYIAKGLVSALGYDYDDIVQNLAQLRYTINNFAVRVNSLCVPKDLDIFHRHAFIPTYWWKDSDEDKAALYAFQFDHYFKWSGTAYDTGSALIMTETPWGYNSNGVVGSCKYSDIVTFCDTIIKDLMSNEDIGIMSGDIKKAFGDNLFIVNGIPEDYAVLPLFDEMVLAQIHNANSVGYVVTGSSGTNSAALIKPDVHQSNGQLIFTPYVTALGRAGDGTPPIKQVLDCGFNNPTVEYNMEATRLKTDFDPNEVIDLGSENTGGGN